MSNAAPAPTLQRGVVKQVLSGDAVIIRGQPKGGPPPERQLCLSNITAPRVARRATANAPETKDEPWSWEAREFLRKKCIGKEIAFTVEYKVPGSGREYGCIYLGSDTSGENLTESLISEGLVEVRRAGIKATDEAQQRLIQLEDGAKAAGLGKWSSSPPTDHIRDCKWIVEEPRKLVDSKHNKPVKAVIEHVRDGCTVRAFLLPDFQYVTLMLSGIKAPMTKADGSTEPFTAEAKYFVESRLLQRDVEIILEGVSNQNVLGTVLHPNGNITEMLLKDGFARCVDWSIGVVSQGVEKYRAAEKMAKEKRLRIWKDWTPASATASMGSVTEREYTGKVIEVMSADGLTVKASGENRKIFLSSIRPPRPQQAAAGENPSDLRKNIRERPRPLYDVPYMFEAREFLRKKLIGKRVNVKVDYVQPAGNFPEKVCCTVTISNSNVAEALVSKGLATVIRYRQDDDSRSSCYDDLLGAEARAQKKQVGLHSTKEPPIHRIQDMTAGESAKAKQFLPFLTRQNRVDALVEFVASGSRLRVYIPKETCLLTLLLNGIQCPRGARPAPGPGNLMLPADPFGEEAAAYTKDMCMQREVEIKVDTMDKAGNFIGWLYVDGVNMSVSLVENGLAKLFYTAEGSPHQRELETAEAAAKKSKLGIWASHVEELKEAIQEVDDTQTERHRKFENVVITEVSMTDLSFSAQKVDSGKKLEAFMADFRAEMHANPPLPGSYTPKKGDLCAAKFVDDLWYRARVEKVLKANTVQVLYIDFGNRETVSFLKTAPLPGAFITLAPQAKEYRLAFVQLPDDEDYVTDALTELYHNIYNRTLSMNVEIRGTPNDLVSLYFNEDGTGDVALKLIEEGFLLAENRREKRFQKLLSEYKAAQNIAKSNRVNLWRYGDITQDDAKEFGITPSSR
ncbi:staphylococcal nuclease domain-containing protein 1-like [Watersipora subatra]|uniref:staphylococcal nuclease domain-containing protein 1-like n=1 Tax=Watersipora subatra TaxID=2589382 RepID=UPI00355C89FD